MTRQEALLIINSGNAPPTMRQEALNVYFGLTGSYFTNDIRTAFAETQYVPPAPCPPNTGGISALCSPEFGSILNPHVFAQAGTQLQTLVGDVTYYKGLDGNVYDTTVLWSSGIERIQGNVKYYPRFFFSLDANDVSVRGGQLTQQQLDYIKAAGAVASPLPPELAGTGTPAGYPEGSRMPVTGVTVGWDPAWSAPVAITPTTAPEGTRPPAGDDVASGTQPPNTTGVATGEEDTSTQDVLSRIRALALADPYIGGDVATADHWNYWYQQVTGQEAPAAEDFGFTGPGRFEAVSSQVWWDRLQAYYSARSSSAGGGSGDAGQGGPSSSPAPGPSSKNPFWATLKQHGVKFLLGALVAGGEVYEDPARSVREQFKQANPRV